MSVLLLILGLLLGAACALALGRRSSRALEQERRERMRDELKAISLDVLAQTGDSLAQRLTEAAPRRGGARRRRDGQARGGDQGPRASRCRRSSARSRASSGAWSASAATGRSQLGGDGARARRTAPTRCAGRPASSCPRSSARRRAAPGARSSCATWSRWRAWSPTATSSSRRTIHTDDGRLRPDVLVRLPGGKLIVVDSKVPLDAYLAAIEAARDDAARAAPRPPRPPDARPHHQARLEGLPAPVRLDARAGRDVRALRRHLPGRARRGSGADRVRRRAAGADGHADDPDRAAARRALRLEAGADRRVRARDRRVRRASCTAGWARSPSRSPRSAASSTRP